MRPPVSCRVVARSLKPSRPKSNDHVQAYFLRENILSHAGQKPMKKAAPQNRPFCCLWRRFQPGRTKNQLAQSTIAAPASSVR